jgi:hypothetical protein
MRKPAIKNENPKDKFKRLASLRTNAVIQRLRILGNLSNRQLYDYESEDIEKIFAAINKQLKTVKAKFVQKESKEFKL